MNEEERYLNNLYKIEYIKRKHKRDNLLLEMSFLNFEGYYIYICAYYVKKLKTHKLYWFDLDEFDTRHYKRYLNELVFNENLVNTMYKYLGELDKPTILAEEVKSLKNIVTMEVNIPNLVNDKISFTTVRFLPFELGHLISFLEALFEQLPNKLSFFYNYYAAKVLGTMEKFNIMDDYKFDIQKADLKEVFGETIYNRGLEYYKKNKVKYLEKIDDTYYAYVTGKENDYVVAISTDKQTGNVLINCSCPCNFACNHACAVILAIRDKKFNKFAKVSYLDPNIPSIERIENFSYYLCAGMSNDNFIIINSELRIELVPIYDANNTCNWKVLSDTKDKVLKDLRK